MHLLDLLFGLAARGPRFFPDGWGDRAVCDTIHPECEADRPPARIAVELSPFCHALGGQLAEGTFESPQAALPACARTARVRVLLPDGPLAGVAVHLAASGDQGFAMRLRFAAPLLAHGIGAVVLENAYYGARRPPAQVRHALRCVSDLHLMGSATFREGRALLRWIREALGAPAGVTGFSMGGQMAAMVGAAVPFPVAVVPVAASCAPDSVLRDGVLRHVVDFTACAADGDAAAARAALLDHLSRFSVEALPAPVAPEAAIVVGTRDDGVVPPVEMERIARHWGCELRWLPAGHVSAVLHYQGQMRRAIADAFDRLARAEAEAPGRVTTGRRPSRATRRATGAATGSGRGDPSAGLRPPSPPGTAGTGPRASSRARRPPA
jgi:hypothetical protein